MLEGSFDQASHDSLSGWAFDREAPEEPVRLIVTVNGELLQRVIANQFRVDLAAAGIGDGRHSFHIILPEPLPWLEAQTISIRREGDGAEIEGSPKVLPSPTVLDDTLAAKLAALLQAAPTDEDVQARLAFLAAQAEDLLRGRTERLVSRQARRSVVAYRRRWGQLPPTGGESLQPYRALVIDEWAPVAGRDAGSDAALSHMAALQRLGFDVAFASMASAPDAAAAALEARGIGCCRQPWFATVEEALSRLGPELDLVYLHRVGAASAYLRLARHHARRARVVFSVADLHHLRLQRQADVQRRPALRLDSRQLREDELLAAVRADAVLTHSSYEAALLREGAPSADVHLVRWAVQAATSPKPPAERHGLAFVGNFAHQPNLHAARWLVEEILPLVQAADPSIEALLVGSEMPDGLRRLARPGLKALGQVPDLTAVLQAVRLTAAPLTFGAGVKGKVVDSLAAGAPCVCTPLAAEGLNLPPELQALVATDAQGFAQMVLRLHADLELAERCVQAGLAYVREQFSEVRLDETLGAALGMAART